MNQFKSEGQGSFSRWLVTIAKNCLLNRINEYHRLKRGRGYKRAHSPAKTSSIASLVAVVAEDTHTPSRSAAQHERQRAVQVGLASLKDDQRTAVTLRYLDALPVADIAERMDRTEHAVHMLCNRGIKKLKGILGSWSKYASGG